MISAPKGLSTGAGRRHLVGEEMEERFGDIQTAEDMLEHGAAVVAVGLAGEQVGICAWTSIPSVVVA